MTQKHSEKCRKWGEVGRSVAETPVKLAQRSMCDVRGLGLCLSSLPAGDSLYRVCLPYAEARGAHGGVC